MLVMVVQKLRPAGETILLDEHPKKFTKLAQSTIIRLVMIETDSDDDGDHHDRYDNAAQVFKSAS